MTRASTNRKQNPIPNKNRNADFDFDLGLSTTKRRLEDSQKLFIFTIEIPDSKESENFSFWLSSWKVYFLQTSERIV